jgi:hypothetical protein
MIMATPPNTPNMFSAAAVHAPNSVQQSLCVNSEFTVPETPVNASNMPSIIINLCIKLTEPSNGTGKMLASPPPSDDSLLGASPENSTTSADTKGQLNNMIRLFSTYQQEMDRKDSLIAAKVLYKVGDKN